MKYTKENYQEFALDYLENLMSGEDRISFQHFLQLNPLIKEEIEDLSIVTLPHFEPEFLRKDDLIKPVSTQAKIFPIYLRRIAAATLLLLMVSVFWLNRKDNFRDLTSTPILAPVIDQDEQSSQIEKVKEDAPLMAKDLATEEVQSITPANDDSAKKQSSEEKLQGQDLAGLDPKPIDQIARLPQNQNPSKEIEMEPKISTTEFEEINVAEKIVVVFIDQRTIVPALDINPILSAMREPMLYTIAIEQESRTKIGKLLAKANLLPSGLKEEIASGGLRDKIIPESYTDSK